MEDEIKDIDSIIQHWRESSEQNYSTMQNLMKTKEYSWALFMGHLVIEKLIKALYVKKYISTLFLNTICFGLLIKLVSSCL